ncbi:hypothetical protein K490DRAFT_37682 [Saccharata proteae CBS 121410]|uniref:Cyclin N-terminal domain-containing protein n=1 Tax=Saccharata proteae CBS 121410 TaxID=1314787 RepID=A0A6A5YC92_9PEZI|nr:hypothetical protein K490DRAFT_37682 [Saccharata proteae CBS 121410]
MESPPVSVSSSSSSRRASVDSVDDYADYFANYVPLSNLPTPPPVLADEEKLKKIAPRSTSNEHDMTGPALHLTRLVPSNACKRNPCVATIIDYLSRSCLPVEAVGLAACILDALSMRFAKAWRNALSTPISSPASPSTGSSLHVRHDSFGSGINSAAEPELIILSSLVLAAAYLDDHHFSARHWAEQISSKVFTARQINATQNAILRDIDYDMHSFTPAMVEEMVVDMQRAAAVASFSKTTPPCGAERTKPALSLEDASSAIWCNGLVTPEPSPGEVADPNFSI